MELSYDTDKAVIGTATNKQTGEELVITPGNGTDDWIASVYCIGETNHRRGLVETHNEMMLDTPSLGKFEVELFEPFRVVEGETLVRRLREEA